MTPKIVYIDDIPVYGYGACTSYEQEENTESSIIRALWYQLAKNRPSVQRAQHCYFSVYHSFEKDADGCHTLMDDFCVTIGIQTRPPDYKKKTIIQGGKYLKFSFKGGFPHVVYDGWSKIIYYFDRADCPYERSFETDFEYYTKQECDVDIFIGIR